MSTKSAAAYPFLNVWEYTINGVIHRGAMIHFTDRGGTDVSYWYHRLNEKNEPILFENGGIQLDILSGATLKAAKRIGNVTNPLKEKT